MAWQNIHVYVCYWSVNVPHARGHMCGDGVVYIYVDISKLQINIILLFMS